MESTPLSTRRITRSLAAAAAAASAQKSAAAVHAQPRAALHDITNDSPIVGLAAGGLVETRAKPRGTPGSGEALLRGQVKTLLQKVDEEVIRPVRIHALLAVSRSPAQLLAPTPANTPQLGVDSVAREDITVMTMGLIPKLQVIAASPPLPPSPAEDKDNLGGESQLSRALVFDDSPGKSGQSTDDSVALQGSSYDDISLDDDSSSVWSIQVNVGSEELEEEYRTEDELEEEDEEEEEYKAEDEGWHSQDEDDDGECLGDLCEGMSKMTVLGEEEQEEKKKAGLPAFEGTHTRFLYNSDDEMVERKEVANAAAEHGALLRGMPVPEGKHLRFHDDDDE